MLKTFAKGGVHPAENKLSAHCPIEKLPLPPTVIIPVSQHLGAPSKPIVAKNDKVKAGQLIAESSGFVSANIHSSVSGTVSAIDNYIDSSGYKRMAIAINVEGDEWIETVDLSPELKKEIFFSPEEIAKKISDAGIVGLGGATFPTHVKLTIPDGKKAEVLILNGVECEPYLTSDHRLMMEKSHEILVGTLLMMRVLNVKKAFIGIENNKPDAIARFSKLVAEYPGIEVVPLKVKYPQGGEKQLIKAVINREVPSGGLPVSVGAVVQNVGTAFAVYEAVQKNKPLVERVVTVTGIEVKKPSNFMVRIGTPTQVLIEAAGGMPENGAKVINGGPMMGKALSDLNSPVTKGTSGILIMHDEIAYRRPVLNCIRCAKCVSACPMGLEPYLLMNYIEKSMWEETQHNHVLDCMECGSCAYICPADRPLLDYIRLGKSTVNKIIRSKKQ